MNLDKFLFTRKSYGNDPVTHTSFIGGRYYINNEDYPKFQELYFKSTFQDNVKNFLIERNTPVFKFYLDIDFDKSVLKKDIDIDFIKIINNISKKVLNTNESLVSVRDTEDSKYNKIHINFFDIEVTSIEGLNYREKIVELCKVQLSDYTDKWDIVVDKSIYRNGGLRMYGSLKNKSGNAYRIYDIDKNIYPEIDLEIFKKTCIRTLSSPSVFSENIIIEPSEIETFVEENNNKLYDSVLKLEKINKVGESLICVSLENKICPFVNREHKRTKNNSSAKSPLYLLINKNGLSLRCHNEECREMKKPSIPIPLSDEIKEIFGITNEFLIKSLSCSHYDVAKCVFEFYKDRFMVEGVKPNDDWYEFQGHKWVKSFSLWSEISENFVKYYSDLEDETGVIKKLIFSLKSVGFKSSVIKECVHIFNHSDPAFIKKLDENINLMCFENGVLELTKPVLFRDGLPTDYLTFSTNINYKPYNPMDKYTQEVEYFFRQIFVDEELREYALKTMASCLIGGSDEHFHIWSGCGSNGKSSIIQLIEKTLGDYSCKLPVSLLTNKRAGSANASPEVMRTKGRRFVSMQEPENGDDLKVGLLKELTGNDKIVARELYKNSVEFLPQFKIFLCCNDLPTISADDNGTWRRLRVVEFKSKFTDKPDKDNKYEFKKDPDLFNKMKNWPEAFISILVKYYNNTTIIKEPDEVMVFTNQYKHENDVIEMFCDSELVENKDSLISFNEIWNRYINWCRDSGIRNLSKMEFKKKFKKKFKEQVINKSKGFLLDFINCTDYE